MKEFELKYGCNPNQKPAKIYMADGSELPITILNGVCSGGVGTSGQIRPLSSIFCGSKERIVDCILNMRHSLLL